MTRKIKQTSREDVCQPDLVVSHEAAIMHMGGVVVPTSLMLAFVLWRWAFYEAL